MSLYLCLDVQDSSSGCMYGFAKDPTEEGQWSYGWDLFEVIHGYTFANGAAPKARDPSKGSYESG